jgi:hypothetical protein
LVFEGTLPGKAGTIGAVDIPDVVVDSGDHFQISFVIPKGLHSVQQSGGGPVRPGIYDFSSKPVRCFAAFTVTGS